MLEILGIRRWVQKKREILTDPQVCDLSSRGGWVVLYGVGKRLERELIHLQQVKLLSGNAVTLFSSTGMEKVQYLCVFSSLINIIRGVVACSSSGMIGSVDFSESKRRTLTDRRLCLLPNHYVLIRAISFVILEDASDRRFEKCSVVEFVKE